MTRQQGGLVGLLVTIKNLIGIASVLGVFYLTVPWRIIRLATSEKEITTEVFNSAIRDWAFGLTDNILLLILLLFIAVLTYGPEVLDLVAGRGESKPPRF